MSEDHSDPFLSVVIPTSRAGEDLEICLVSLFEQRYPNLEVIVVDNASGDATLATLPGRFPGLRVIHNAENRGFAEASNQGIEAATGELILFLNDDTSLESGALGTLVATLQARPVWGACQAKLLRMDNPQQLDTAGSFLTRTGFLVHRGAFEPEANFVESDEIFAAKGAALLVRRRALEDTGSFDRDFFAYLEETDLCWRLWLAGWEIGFAADARVLHRIGATASALPIPFVQFHSFKNRVCMLLKNLDAATLVWLLPYHLLLCFGLAGWYAIRGRGELGLAILRAVAWNASHLRGTLRKRRRIQAGRRVSDAMLMRRITAPTSLRTLVAYAGVTAGSSKADDTTNRN